MNKKSTRRRNAVIAAIAGAALLVGGSTYALWSASATLTGGTITAGDLNITAGTYNAWDVSADRTDSSDAVIPQGTSTALDGLTGHTITLKDWKMVPGDEVAMVFPYTITLEGDNLVASLEFSSEDLTDLINEDWVSLDYQLFDVDGVAVTSRESIATVLPVVYFQGKNAAEGDVEPNTTDIPIVDGTAQYTFVLYVTFADLNTPDEPGGSSVRYGATQSLLELGDNLKATLTQVRCDDPNVPTANLFACGSNG